MTARLTLPDVKTRPFSFALGGGLDQVSTQLELAAGQCIRSLNYEPDLNGGYRRIRGYERYDGRARPSLATYSAVACSISLTLVAGDALTIGAATGTFVRLVGGGILLTDVTGTVPANTAIMRGVDVVGATGSNVFDLAEPITAALDAEYLVAAAAYRRAFIQPVPGSGPVRGVTLYNDTVYAWRDQVGPVGGMWKSSGAGWVAVALPFELYFTNGTFTPVGFVPGDTVTGSVSGATGVVRRVILSAGAWGMGSPAAGRLIIDTVVGNFSAADKLRANADVTDRANCSGVQTQIVLPAGGKYVFEQKNFYGQAVSRRLYAATGVGFAFEFDGTTLSPIRTGAVPDVPSKVKKVGAVLLLAQGSSVQFSEPGEPLQYRVINNAGEVAFGSEVTDIARFPNDVTPTAGVFTRDSVATLVMSGVPANWTSPDIAEVGALPDTVGQLSSTYFFDARGINSLAVTAARGGMSGGTLSQNVQPTVDILSPNIIGAHLVRNRTQYRAVASDGRVLVMWVQGSENSSYGARYTFMPLEYPIAPSCMYSGKSADGRYERIFYGAADGYVYEMDVGSTFDGAAIEGFIQLAYNHCGSPTREKDFLRGRLEMTSDLYTALRVSAEFNLGDPNKAIHIAPTVSLGGLGGYWNLDNWNEFFWSAQSIAAPKLRIRGSGATVSLLFYSNTTLDFGHVLQSVTLDYLARRPSR